MRLEDARHILVCLRYGIGDVVMETPALTALRAHVPEARLIMLGAEPAVELLRGDPRADEVHAYQGFGIRHRWDRGSGVAARAAGAWLDERAFDLVLDPVHAPPAVSWEVWGREMRCLQSDEEAEETALSGGDDGVGAIRAAVRSGWGVPVPGDRPPRLHLGEERRWAARFLAAVAPGDTAPVAIMPAASHELKRWPLERFAAVADRILEEWGGLLLVFGAPGSDLAEELVAAVRHGDGRVIGLPPFHLRRSAALLERCGLFVSNDTGLMHIAAAVGTRVVSVFGPSYPDVYRPPGEGHRAVGGLVDCRHRHLGSLRPPDCWTENRCLLPERSSSCIDEVGVERVLDAVREAVAGQRREDEVA